MEKSTMRFASMTAVVGLAALLSGCRQQAPVLPTPMADSPVPVGHSPRPVQRRERGGNAAQVGAAAGAFDYYLLTLSWSPEFCATHPDKPECAARPRFVLHGLWPENVDGSYPEHCSDAPGPRDADAFADLYPDAGLLRHEWQTHGTCSGLEPDAFFQAARKACKSVIIPPVLANDTDELQLAPSEILGDFVQVNPWLAPDELVLSCGNNRLTAVEVCLGKDLKPVSCQGVRSCRANVVKVTPP